jgi:hypothetical protein
MRIWWLLPVLVLAVSQAGYPAELVVIASDGSSLKAGTVIDGSHPVKIPAGGRVTLISSSGKTIVLEGPYDAAPDPTQAPADGDLVESLSRLIDQEDRSSTALAVFRGTDKKAPADRPDLWGIDIARAGSYCLRRDVPAFLWWDAARAGAIVNLSDDSDRSRGARIRWPSAKRQLAWPDALTLADGAVYVARFRSGDEGERLMVRFMPDLSSDAHRIAWMAEHGCTGQALKVLNALAGGEL